MREILFRGKRKDNGKWVYGGSLLQFAPGDSCYIAPSSGMVYIAEDDAGNIARLASDIPVIIPETVGQFTGLTANGTKIFEGDIVEITDDEGRTDFSDGGIGTVGFFDGLWYVNGQVHNALYDLDKCYHIEVIGNIHDNPELMEV
jgi:uncharacterized phage protein (TIGR01671 family)